MKDYLKKILGLGFMVAAFALIGASSAYAAAPTASTAVMNNVNTVTHNVDFVVTGTDFDQFISAQSTTANGTDLAKITFNGFTAVSAIIANATTMTVQFDYRSVGTGKIGQTLVFADGTVEDAGNISNLVAATTIVAGSITDSASPVLLSAVLSNTGTRNRISFTYSEPVVVANGASTVTIGDTTTAGSVAGIGGFATGGNVVVATTKNTVGGTGTTVVTVDLADQTGGFMTAASTTIASGIFTPVASAEVTDAALNQVAVGGTPTSSGTWDLIKPTLSSITVSDSAGTNGRIDRAVSVFSKDMRINSFTDANGALGATGTVTGTFTVVTTTATFNRSVDDNAVNTATSAGDFTYSGATSFLTDLAGNLLNTTTPGTIVTADAAEIDAANPILVSAVIGVSATRNKITFTYSEAMSIGDGASTASIGDTTVAGTVAGFGSFATAGNVVVNTTKNTISGNGTAAIVLSFADQAGGFMSTGSSTEPSGVFTPVLSGLLTDLNSLQVAVAATPTASGTGWDLIKPTLTSITVSDAAGSNNGRIDRAVLVFDTDVRANSFTNANGSLGTSGTVTGAFTVGTTTATFNRTVDDNAVDTSTVAGNFLYSGATTFITDIFGNLLNTTVDGTIITADATEVDNANPIVVSTTPANTSVAQSNTDSIVVIFSEPMTTGSVTASTFGTTASGVATGDVYTPAWSNSNKTVTLSHVVYRSAGHEYTATFTTGVTDASSALKALITYTWTFTPVGTRSSSSGTSTSDVTAPTGTSVSISGGASKVSSSNVTLTLGATGATQMVIANTPDFYGASWETYATTKAWVLNSGNGTRTVYAKFRDAAGNVSNLVEASTVVDSSLVPAVAPAPGTTTVTTTVTSTTPATPATHIEGCEPGKGNLFSPTSGKSCTIPATPATPGSVTTTVTTTSSTGVTVVSVFTRSLKYGEKGSEIKKFQQFLKDRGHLKGKVDGSFGPMTKAALRAFQKANGLTADGIFGSKTLKKINELL